MIFTLRILFIAILVIPFTVKAVDPTPTTASGLYTLTNVPKNDVKLTCTCNSTTFSVAPNPAFTTATAVAFDFIDIYQMAGACPFTPDSQNTFHDIPNCTFESNDGKTSYLNVSIGAIGYHCMSLDSLGSDSRDCYAPYAMAANWNVTPISNTSSYTINSTAPSAAQPTPCTTKLCNGVSCCNQWSGQFYSRAAGSLTVTGGPALTPTCHAAENLSTADSLSIVPVTLRDGVFDFETLHDTVAPNHPETNVTVSCQLSGADGKNYGQMTFADINGIRTSSASTYLRLWSALVTLSDQPQISDYSLSAPTVLPNADTSGNYHTLWGSTLTKTEAGSLTITGGPTLTPECQAANGLFLGPLKLRDGILDFEAIHDTVAPNHPETNVTVTCQLNGSDSGNYGAITFTDINGVRTSGSPTHVPIWSATVSIASSPSVPGYYLSAPTLLPNSDTDVSGNYHTLWGSTLTSTEAGSLTVTGGPTLTPECHTTNGLAIGPLKLRDGVLDFQAIHDKLAPNHPETNVTVTCQLHGSDGGNYGLVSLADINGIRTSGSATHVHMWSASVTLVGQPTVPNYVLSAPTLAPNSDTDVSGNYHTLWASTLTKTKN